MPPVPPPPNTVASSYPGAGRIGAIRRHPSLTTTDPEDWIASTTARTGLAPLGLTTRADGTLLLDRVNGDPHAWFGPEHTARYGARSVPLVMHLGAGRRLPLHIYPDRAFARQHLDGDYGKIEAWLVLHAEPDACAHLSFSRDIRASELLDWVENQNTGALLTNTNTNTNTNPVNASNVLLPRAARNRGRHPRSRTARDDGPLDHARVGRLPARPGRSPLWAPAQRSPHRSASRSHPRRRTTTTGGQCIRSQATGQTGSISLLFVAAEEFLVTEKVVPVADGEQCDPRFAIMTVADGVGIPHSEAATDLALASGRSYLISPAAGTTWLTGELSAIRCCPA